MDTEQRIRRLENTLALLHDYIDRYNITNVITVDYLRLLSLRREEALLRHRINYEYNNNNNSSSSSSSSNNNVDREEEEEDEIDGSATV